MKTIGTKVSDEFREEAVKAAKGQGKTISDLLRICIEEIVNGHYKLEGDHLIPTTDYMIAITPDVEEPRYDYDALGVDRLLEVLERKNYNLRDTIDSMRQNVENASAYSRKKGMDWGA